MDKQRKAYNKTRAQRSRLVSAIFCFVKPWDIRWTIVFLSRGEFQEKAVQSPGAGFQATKLISKVFTVKFIYTTTRFIAVLFDFLSYPKGFSFFA